MSRSKTTTPFRGGAFASSPLATPSGSGSASGSAMGGVGMGQEEVGGTNPNQPRVKMEGFDMPSNSRSISSPSPYATSFPSSYRPSPMGGTASYSYGGSGSGGGGGGFFPGSSGFGDDLLDLIGFGAAGPGPGPGGMTMDLGGASSRGTMQNLGAGDLDGMEGLRGSREGTVPMEDVNGPGGRNALLDRAGGTGPAVGGASGGGESISFAGDFANLGFAIDHDASPSQFSAHHHSPAQQQWQTQQLQHQQQLQQQQHQQQQVSMFQYKPVAGNPYDLFDSPSTNQDDGGNGSGGGGGGGGADPHAILGGGGGGGEMDLDLSAFGGGAFFDSPAGGNSGYAPGQFSGAANSAPAGLYNVGAGPGSSGLRGSGLNTGSSPHPFEANGVGVGAGTSSSFGFGFRSPASIGGTGGGFNNSGTSSHGFSLNAPSHMQQLQQLRLMQIQQAGMPFSRNFMAKGSDQLGGRGKSSNGGIGSPSSLDGMAIGGNHAGQHFPRHGSGQTAGSIAHGGGGGGFGHSLPVGGSPFSSHDASTVGSSMTLSQGGLSFNSVLADLMSGGNGQGIAQGGHLQHLQQQQAQLLQNNRAGSTVQPNPSMCLREYQALLRGAGINASDAMSVMSSTQVSTPSSSDENPMQHQQQQQRQQPPQLASASSYKSVMGAPATPTLNASSSLPAHQRSGSIARRSASRARGEKQAAVANAANGKRGPRTSFGGTDATRPNMALARQISASNVKAGGEVANSAIGQRESSVGPQRRKPLKRGTSHTNPDGSPKVNSSGGALLPGGNASGPSDSVVNATRTALNNASLGIMSPQSLQRFLGQVTTEGANSASRSSHSTGPNTSFESPSSHTTASSGDVDEAAGPASTTIQQSQVGGSRAPPSAIPDRVIKTERSYSLDSVGSMRPSFRRMGSELGDGNMETVDEDAVEDEDADDKPIRPLTSEEIAQARKSRRRLSHNEVERKRRETINEKIVELEQLLPPHVVASALAATQTETIKEEDEDIDDDVQLLGKGAKKSSSKSRGRKAVKKQVVPERLCKGTVLCLTVDLIKQMQEIMQHKDAREQELLSQIHAMQAQMGPGDNAHQQFLDSSHFSNDGFGHGNELQSIADYGVGFGLMDMDDRHIHEVGDDQRGRTRGR